MPLAVNHRIGSHIDHKAGRLRERQTKPLSESRLWRRRQGILRTMEFANWRDHTMCNCPIHEEYKREVEDMPKVVEGPAPGDRSGPRTGSQVKWLIDFDEVLSGQMLEHALTKGLRLERGEDFEIVNGDGQPVDEPIKTTPEKVRKELALEIAERLNRPTTVRIPPTGRDVAAEDRQWVEFRPRDTFASDDDREQYIAGLA